MTTVERVDSPRDLFRNLDANDLEEETVKIPVAHPESSYVPEGEEFPRWESDIHEVEIDVHEGDAEEAALDALGDAAEVLTEDNVAKDDAEEGLYVVVRGAETFIPDLCYEGDKYTYYASDQLGYEIHQGDRRGYFVAPDEPVAKVFE